MRVQDNERIYGASNAQRPRPQVYRLNKALQLWQRTSKPYPELDSDSTLQPGEVRKSEDGCWIVIG